MDGVTEIEKAEIAAIVSALRETGGNATLAARQLGLGQATVYRKLKKYGIKRRDKDRNGLVPFSKRSGPLNGKKRSG